MTITKPIKQPRIIRPELVDIGDDISVELKTPVRGIKTVLRGIVGKRIDNGATRYYMTTEGGTLFAFDPGRTPKYTITLYGRATEVSETLFEMDIPQTRLRIAG